MGKEKRKMHLGGWQCLLWVFSPFVKLPEHWHCCPHWALVPKGSSRASPSSYDSRAAVHVPLSCSLPKLLSCTVSSSPSATTHSKSCRNAPARAPLCILALCPLCFHFLNPLAACLRGGSGYHGGPQTQPARASAGLELSSLAPARRSRCEAAPPARAAGHPRFPTGDLHQHIPAPRQTGRWLCLGSTGVFPGQIKSVCFFFFFYAKNKKNHQNPRPHLDSYTPPQAFGFGHCWETGFLCFVPEWLSQSFPNSSSRWREFPPPPCCRSPTRSLIKVGTSRNPVTD